ncbi:MAG: hypothetical protein PHR06_14805 [Candidatus Cloacimonetes bacterium]|nr:hypothetical protein [Candidatus Cloacimonadota bacterium]
MNKIEHSSKNFLKRKKTDLIIIISYLGLSIIWLLISYMTIRNTNTVIAVFCGLTFLLGLTNLIRGSGYVQFEHVVGKKIYIASLIEIMIGLVPLMKILL